MLNVHVRVNDASTGKPTPVRLSIVNADGRFYPPLGRVHDFPVGRGEAVGGHVYANQERFTYIDGGCEVPLPANVPLTVTASKGPGYVPVQTEVTLGPGQLSLRLAIAPLGGAGDFTMADGRCHFLSPHAAKLEADGEGLHFTNLLACVQELPSTDGHLYRLVPNMEAFSGQMEAVPGVYVNTCNTHPVLGKLALLNCHRAVFPLTFGGDDPDDWSLADWCQQCHRKKGLAVWCDVYRGEHGLAGEGIIDAILGKLDALEVDALDRKTPLLPLWYRLLNVGARVPLIGSSAKGSNREFLGSMRTLTPLTSSYAEWIEHVRSGRSVVTNGPLLRFFVNDAPFTTALTLGEPSVVRLQAAVVSAVPYERVEIIANGSVIGQTTDGVLEIEHRAEQSCWLAARCWGAKPSTLYPGQPVFAHSAPTWLTVGETPFPRDASACGGFRRDVQRVREWIQTAGQFVNPKRQEQLLALADEALAKLA